MKLYLLLLLLLTLNACDEQGRIVTYRITMYSPMQTPTIIELVADSSVTTTPTCRSFFNKEVFVGEVCGTYTIQVIK